jgi:hypothetical protein
MALYYLYKFLIEGPDLEVSVLDNELPANMPQVFPITSSNADVRVKQGGEYTISFWMYITSWDYRSGLPKSVLQIVDSNLKGIDAVIRQRVVINFMTWEEQKQVLKNAFDALKVGGKLILVENTFEGFENLNSVRRTFGLPDVKLHDWHNYFLVYERFMEFMSEQGTLIAEENFNTYYLFTRVFGNLIAEFEGFGIKAVKDPIFEKIDSAAREIQGRLNQELKFNLPKGSSFGPIQVFVFQKTA